MPNILVYRNPLNNNLVLAGDIGVKEELVDDDYPTLDIHKDTWKKMKTEMDKGNEEALKELTGENLDTEELIHKTEENTIPHGKINKVFNMKKLKLIGSYDRTNQRKIYPMKSTEVEVIGKEKKHMKVYINIIANLMGMSGTLKNHFLNQCMDSQDDIHVILGQKDGALLMHDIIPEQTTSVISYCQIYWYTGTH